MNRDRSNIILIGMAGSGKSSVGRKLARATNLSFIDTDDLIVHDQKRPLQDIIDSEGVMGFRRIEENILENVSVRDHVIATGGSSIYSGPGMGHLEKNGFIVWLKVRIDVLKKRVGDTSERGLVKLPGQTFDELYAERYRLYERFADITIDCTDLNPDEVCKSIIEQLSQVKNRGLPG